MDISYFDTQVTHGEGSELQLKGPDDKETECYLWLIGQDSKKMQQIRKDCRKKVLDETYANVTEAIRSPEMCAQMVTGWRGMESNGKELKFSEELLVKFLETAPYIRDQIIAFVSDRKNFIKG